MEFDEEKMKKIWQTFIFALILIVFLFAVIIYRNYNVGEDTTENIVCENIDVEDKVNTQIGCKIESIITQIYENCTFFNETFYTMEEFELSNLTYCAGSELNFTLYDVRRLNMNKSILLDYILLQTDGRNDNNLTKMTCYENCFRVSWEMNCNETQGPETQMY